METGMAVGSALVRGEDSESDEEINTEHMTSSMETSLRRLANQSSPRAVPGNFTKPGIVAGEGSETDEEEETDGTRGSCVPNEQTDGVTLLLRVPAAGSRDVSGGSTPQSSRRSSGDSTAIPPPSLLHKKLCERTTSLRKNIVDRVLRIYHATCRNLTVVNDNLSRNQATIEKVNSQLKKADQDLEKVNLAMQLVTEGVGSFAPTLRMDIALRPKPSVSLPPPLLPPSSSHRTLSQSQAVAESTIQTT